MSWKSIVITGLLCVLASPVWAAPSIAFDLVRGADDPGPLLPVVLDSNGDWQWSVSVTPDGALFADNPPNGVGGSVATELGFTASGGSLISITKDATNFPNDDPGTAIAGFPTGNGVQMSGNNAIANLGSDYFTTATAKLLATLKAVGPSKGASVSSGLTLLGAYSGNARIAQASQNFDTYNGSQSYVAILGDANLNGVVDLADFNAVINNFGFTTNNWNKGNFNNTKNPANTGTTATTVDLADFNDVINNFGDTTPGAGAGAVAAVGVPEPASVVLAALMAMLFGIVGGRRR